MYPASDNPHATSSRRCPALHAAHGTAGGSHAQSRTPRGIEELVSVFTTKTTYNIIVEAPSTVHAISHPRGFAICM